MSEPARPRDDAGAPLTAAQACDLDLVLGGVLPDGHLLGGVVAGSDLPVGPPAPGGTSSVRLPATLLDGPVPGQALRDVEHTPLADVLDVVPDPLDPSLVVAQVRRRRAREARPLASLALDLEPTEPLVPGAVLVVLRPPVDTDTDVLEDFARLARQGDGEALVLVPEGGSSRDHPPARTAVAAVRAVLDRLGVDARVLVAPLHLRDPESDVKVAAVLAARLAGRRGLVLGDTAGDRLWTLAAAALDDARSVGPVPHVHEAVSAALRRWRPPRPRRGLVVMLTGLSGSGKSTLARDLADRLSVESTRTVSLLDGDVVRRLLSSGLGFDREGRETNVRRIGWVAAQVASHGGVAICSPIAPFAATRSDIRAMVERDAGFVLVHVSTPIEVCEQRDLKGLYARARSGQLPDFTGISSPYEVPTDADLAVDTSTQSREQAVQRVLDLLAAQGWVD
jgi:sulfate adenylyltransferase